MELSKKFKKLRKDLNLSQGQLAKTLSLSTGSIYKYESGKVIPRADVLSRLEGMVAKQEHNSIKKEFNVNSKSRIIDMSKQNMLQVINMQCERIRLLENEIAQIQEK